MPKMYATVLWDNSQKPNALMCAILKAYNLLSNTSICNSLTWFLQSVVRLLSCSRKETGGLKT